MRKILLLTMAVVLIVTATYGQKQKRWIQDVKYSTWLGIRDFHLQEIPSDQNLDFINYLYANQKGPEGDYLGFAWLIKFNNHWEADVKYTLNFGYNRGAHDIKIRYFPENKKLGYSLGLFSFPTLIRGFANFNIEKDLDFHTGNWNGRETRIHDHGFTVGVALPLHYKFLHCILRMNGGYSSIGRFEETIKQKELDSNLKRIFVYETLPSYNIFFYPEIEAYIDLIRINKARLGIQVQASWYATHKFLNYQRSTYEWTMDSPIIDRIESPMHAFEKNEVNVGLYLRW